MRSSTKALATYVDRLIERGEAIVSESAASAVSFHGLSEENARHILQLLSAADLRPRVIDSADQEVDDLDRGVAPFAVSFIKPNGNDVFFVSTDAFQKWMQNPDPVGLVRVASCSSEFQTEGFVVASWDTNTDSEIADVRSDPGKLVRVLGQGISIPRDIRPFLLTDESPPWTDPAFIAWLRPSVVGLLRSLATEINVSERLLEFVGPPRLKLSWPEDRDWVHLTHEGFLALQRASSWVYALPREAELRFRLFTQEFARLISPGRPVFEAINSAALALEGARIAYNFSLQEVTKDALKGFADLRKGVADDVQKLVESTKQLALSGAGALFYAIGLLATRLTSTTVPVWIIDALAGIGFAYVCVVLFINLSYVLQQKALRPIWKEKLYRYLTDSEYRAMVEGPTSKCETQLNWMMLSVLLLSILVFGGVAFANHRLPQQSTAPAVAALSHVSYTMVPCTKCPDAEL